MTTLGARARGIISDSGQRHKKIASCVIAWSTETGACTIAIGSGVAGGAELKVFLERIIKHLNECIDNQGV